MNTWNSRLHKLIGLLWRSLENSNLATYRIPNNFEKCPETPKFSSARIAQAHGAKIALSFEQLSLQPLCKDQRELFHKNPFFATF